MTTTISTTPGYTHTQHAPLCLLFYIPAILCLAGGLSVGRMPDVAMAIAGSCILVMVALATHHLTVEDRGDRLAIRFGPLPLFRTSVRYADIKRAEVGRTFILDGWGIHYSLRGRWVWNLWGRDCVVVHFKNGRTLRIGTDDAAGLAQFLHGKGQER